MAPVTTIGDDVSTTTTTDAPTSLTDAEGTATSTTQKEMTPATTTEILSEDINQSPNVENTAAATDQFPDDKAYVPIQFADLDIINITLSSTSLLVSLLAIAISIISLCKKGPKKEKPKKELPKMNEFTMHINPTRTFHTYTSPIYNPYFSEEKDDM
jgi:hypothetical protein